jgi:hypothetical protein
LLLLLVLVALPRTGAVRPNAFEVVQSLGPTLPQRSLGQRQPSARAARLDDDGASSEVQGGLPLDLPQDDSSTHRESGTLGVPLGGKLTVLERMARLRLLLHEKHGSTAEQNETGISSDDSPADVASSGGHALPGYSLAKPAGSSARSDGSSEREEEAALDQEQAALDYAAADREEKQRWNSKAQLAGWGPPPAAVGFPYGLANGSAPSAASIQRAVEGLVPLEDFRMSCLLVVLMLAVALFLVTMLVRIARVVCKRRPNSSLGQKVAAIPLTSALEIERMFGLKDKALMSSSQNPGLLMRVQGHVVAKQALSAPWSARPCVMYESSVTPRMVNGIRPTPLACHTAKTEFYVELLGEPRLRVGIQGDDVLLFDMTSGRFAEDSTLSDAQDSWVGFTLGHLTPGSEGTSMQGPLEFRECAVPVSSQVTVVGEISKDRGGELWLCPWRPSMDRSGTIRCESQTTVLALGGALLSDDPTLFGMVTT